MRVVMGLTGEIYMEIPTTWSKILGNIPENVNRTNAVPLTVS
jgi:hypothetical protein